MLMPEVRHAARNLLRAPRFTFACVSTLALALAGTATLTNLLEAFVFRRLAVSAPDQLVGIYPARGEASAGFSLPVLQALRARQQVLTGVCAVTAGYGAINVQIGSGAVRSRASEAVTGNCYELLGVIPAIGRTITVDDAPLGGDPAHVVLISHRVWQEELGASPDVLGRTLRVEGTPLTIIGVLPATYRGLNADEAPDIALPLTLPWTLQLHPPLAMHAVGRLRPGTRIGEAAAHLAAIWPEVYGSAEPSTASRQARPHLRVVPLAHGFSVLRDRYRAALYALVALAGCLLLLACVNVGGLSLARLLHRRQAVAVQLALGAGRRRVAMQLLFEGVAIGGAATLLAVPVASWGAQIGGQSLWTGVRPFTIEPTPLATTLVFTGVIGLLAAVIVSAPGLVALWVHNWDLGGRSVGHGAKTGRYRGLMSAQIALCFVLAFGAALFTGNLYALRQLPLGYDPAGLQWVQLDRTSRTGVVPTIGYVDTIIARLEALPGVERAAMSTSFGRVRTVDTSDSIPVRVDTADGMVRAVADRISPGFFETASIAVQQGREFTWSDVSSPSRVAILSRSLADQLFPAGDAVGKSIKVGERAQPVSIVGVAADASPGDPRLGSPPMLYLSLDAYAPAVPAVLVRLRTGILTAALVRDVVEPLGRHQVLRMSSMQAQTDRFLVQERLITSTSLLFALLAIVVAIAGVYAALSQSVMRRTREMGIRMAVGATPAMVRGLVLKDARRIVVVGVGVGLPLALAGARAARSIVSEAAPATSVALLMAFSLIAISTALVAAWPAQRAARTPLAMALRSE